MTSLANRKYGLCLTRKNGESIVISTIQGQIIITFAEVHGNWVRMRFSMPKEVSVLRAEVLDKQQQRDGISET